MNPEHQPATILVVDDTPMNVILLDRLLRNAGYRVEQAENGPLALERARNNPPNMILLDINMPEMSGYDVCRELKADENLKDIPVIFVSALSDTMDKVMALSVGGVDYVTKPFQAEEVLARIDTHLKIRDLQKRLETKNADLEAEIARRQQVEEELTLQAATDPLTKVFNRRHFFELATKELARSKRSNLNFSIIMMDIDHFKAVNDSYGHLVGDQTLIRFTEICQTKLRPYDVLARYGGEEFVILLPDTDPAEALDVAERLRQEVSQTDITFNSQSFSITISLGVASFEKGSNLMLDKILDRADQAMYQAKQSGRNRVSVWG